MTRSAPTGSPHLHNSKLLFSTRGPVLYFFTMGLNDHVAGLVGEWKGTNKLHAPWLPEPVQKSESTAHVQTKMNDQFLSIEYTWSFQGEPQEGMLILGCDVESDAV